MTLFWRSFLANAAILSVAVISLALTPATVSYPVTILEGVVLTIWLLGAFGVNWWLMRRILQPLAELQSAIERRDAPDATQRVPVPEQSTNEVAALGRAYNAMLDRLADERSRSARLAIAAQEDERSRVSSELHDEVGQTLTGLILRLTVLAGQAGPTVATGLEECKESVRLALEEVRGISARLRPGSLRDLGLVLALRGLVQEMERATQLGIDADLPPECELPEELELVIYRIAQESLTNVARHAHASRIWVQLTCGTNDIDLRIRDDGIGFSGTPHTGITGMRERARLVRGQVDIGPGPDGGTIVHFTAPLLVPTHHQERTPT